MQINLTVNGVQICAEVEPRTLLVHFLREQLHLTGTHIGCDTSQCGACTVHFNGQPVKSCTMLAIQADGNELTTIEGLARNGQLHPLQHAFKDQHALQCGFCTPGIVMAVEPLLHRQNVPSNNEIREALEGNRCRCTGYQNIVAAVRQACEQSK